MTTAADDIAAEEAFEALLAGRPVPEGAAGLAAFTEAVRSSADRPGRPNAALADLLSTGLLTDQSSPSARTARSAGRPPAAARIRIRRRIAMFFPALLAKIIGAGALAQAATGAGIAVVAFTGAGAAGVLPHSVQHGFATVAESVGVQVSDPEATESDEDATEQEAPEATDTDALKDDQDADEDADEDADTSDHAATADADRVTSEAGTEATTATADAPATLHCAPGSTHGQCVSEAAHSTAGVDGRAVSQAAHERNEARRAARAAAPTDDDDATEVESDDDATGDHDDASEVEDESGDDDSADDDDKDDKHSNRGSNSGRGSGHQDD